MANKKLWLKLPAMVAKMNGRNTKQISCLLTLVCVTGTGLFIAGCDGNTTGASSKIFVYSDRHNYIGEKGDKLCAIVDGKVKFYDERKHPVLDDNDPTQIIGFTWGEVEKYQFALPSGYKGAFIGSGRDLCVIVDDKVKSYHNYGQGWEQSRTDFTLPSGYKGVFGWELNLCVIVGGKVKFYDATTGWQETVNFEEFTLPSGYKSVFRVYGHGSFPDILCVTFSDRVEVYSYDNGWKKQESASLPSGFKGDIIDYYNRNRVVVIIDGKAKFYNNSFSATPAVPEFTIPK
jgi:hypothetical protein